jgi:hypothetical protein
MLLCKPSARNKGRIGLHISNSFRPAPCFKGLFNLERCSQPVLLVSAMISYEFLNRVTHLETLAV